jgi:hypothetical protein
MPLTNWLAFASGNVHPVLHDETDSRSNRSGWRPGPVAAPETPRHHRGSDAPDALLGCGRTALASVATRAARAERGLDHHERDGRVRSGARGCCRVTTSTRAVRLSAAGLEGARWVAGVPPDAARRAASIGARCDSGPVSAACVAVDPTRRSPMRSRSRGSLRSGVVARAHRHARAPRVQRRDSRRQRSQRSACRDRGGGSGGDGPGPPGPETRRPPSRGGPRRDPDAPLVAHPGPPVQRRVARTRERRGA